MVAPTLAALKRHFSFYTLTRLRILLQSSLLEWLTTHMSLIRVAFFGVNAVVLNDVLESLIHQTSSTSHVTLSSCQNHYIHTVIPFPYSWKNFRFVNILEQSTRFCSERETSFPVALKCCPSRDPVVLKAQQEPHWPYMPCMEREREILDESSDKNDAAKFSQL